MIIIPIHAETNTTPKISTMSTKFYGTAHYLDKQPVEAGSIVEVKNQYGVTMGKLRMKEDGIYGCQYNYCKNLVATYYIDQTNKTNRTTQMLLTFYVNGIQSKGLADFEHDAVTRFDIVLASSSPTPIPTSLPTSVETTIIPVETTNNINTTSNITSNTTSTDIPVQPIDPNHIPDEVLIAIIICSGFVVISIITGIVYLILTRQSRYDRMLDSDGEWIEQKK